MGSNSATESRTLSKPSNRAKWPKENKTSRTGMKLDENTNQCMGSGQLMKTINRITQYPMIIEYAIPLVC